jgi:hypothetical protein
MIAALRVLAGAKGGCSGEKRFARSSLRVGKQPGSGLGHSSGQVAQACRLQQCGLCTSDGAAVAVTRSQAARAAVLPPRAFLRLYVQRMPSWLRHQARDKQLAQVGLHITWVTQCRVCRQ